MIDLGLTQAPEVRPRMQIGGLKDIPLGRYFDGKFGDKLLSGGSTNFGLVGGRGNTFKTAETLGEILALLERYPEIALVIYDTEGTFAWDRIADMAERYPGLDYEVAKEQGRINLTSISEYSGNDFWEWCRKKSEERFKDRKRMDKDTPFTDSKGNFIKTTPPLLIFIDSLSQFETDAISEIFDKNQIDDGGATTADMRSANIKSRLIVQVPMVSGKGNINFQMTAHVGDEIKIDPYAPAKQLLGFIKKGLKFKNVPEKASFLSNVTWYISNAEPLLHSDKTPKYPKAGFKNAVGDTDLMELSIICGRSKHGPAGHIFHHVVSQTEGYLAGLSEFNYLANYKEKFGMTVEGQHRDHRLAIYPEVLLKRTTVREQIDSDARLRRALEITSEMCQIYEYWVDFPREDVVTPEQLYTKLKEMGYDWGAILDTRGYWTFDHYTNPVRPLSTMDLINIYHGRYIPWWDVEKRKAAGLDYVE